METDVLKAESDSSELSAISYHAGWAIKRARDIIKHTSDEQLQIQNKYQRFSPFRKIKGPGSNL